MRKSSKITLAFLSFAVTFILISSTAVAIPSYNSSITTNSLQQDFAIELANVVAGKGNNVYSAAVSFGVSDGSSYPSLVAGGSPVVDESGLAEALVWLVIYTNQDGFENYLNRAPSDNPEGLAFYALYPSTLSPTQSLVLAAQGAGVFEQLYGVTFNLMYAEADVGEISFYAFQADPDDTVFAAVADDTEGIQSAGYGGLMDASRTTSAPVGWTGYGVNTWDVDGEYRLSMHGMGWVTQNAYAVDESSGEKVYTLSTANVFGTQVKPQSDIDFALSRLKFTFPYPIKPISISPATSNPYPQVTGQMKWDLVHPVVDRSVDPNRVGNEYSVDFKVGMDRTFPNVQNELVINQTKLNSDGILEAEFNLENTGGARANNIALSFPLGPAFNRIVDTNLEIFTIKPTLTLNESIGAPAINLDINIPGVATVNYNALSLQGWFTHANNGSLALWDETATELVLFDETVLGQQIRVAITSVDPNPTDPLDIGGLPVALINAIQTNIIDNMPTDLNLGTAAEVQSVLQNNLAPSLNQTTWEILGTAFDKVPTFTVVGNDFTLVQKDVITGLASSESQWFMEMVHPGLDAGQSDTVSFRIEDIPRSSQKLPLLRFTPEQDPSGFPKGTLTASEQNYNEVMQYIFQGFGYDGRPLSFNPNDDFVEFINSFHSGVYWSPGMTFSYTDVNGFPFFGVSNGQNLQIADDEAILRATVSTDKQSYSIGELKQISINVVNSGDIAAQNVRVHLFQTRLGRDNSIVEDLWYVDSFDVGTLAANGGSQLVTTTDESLSFLGYSGYFAVVEGISDAGQGPEVVPDFLNIGINQYEAGGETHHFVMSTLSGVLTLPEGFDQEPSFPEARVVIEATTTPDLSTSTLNIDDTFTYTVTLRNEGDAGTIATFVQSYNPDHLEVVSLTASEGVATDAGGTIIVSNMALDDATGDNTATVTIEFKVKSADAVLPAGVVQYTIDSESSLGDSANTGVDIQIGGGTPILTLSAGAAAQQQSQTSANQDSSASAYSASSNVGASVNTVQNTESQQTIDDDSAGGGFIGLSSTETLSLMLVPLGLMAIKRRR